MFLLHKRPASVATLVLVLAIISASASQADYWEFKRSNGNMSNGFWLDKSAKQPNVNYDSFTYAQSLRRGTGRWIEAVPTGLQNLTERSTIPRGNITTDRYFVARTKLQGVLGETFYYVKVNNVIRPRLDFEAANVRWEFCTVTLYYNEIQKKAQVNGTLDEEFEREIAEHSAVHEIGHTLKLAHPPVRDILSPYAVIIKGQGKGAGYNHPVPIDQKTILLGKRADNDFFLTPAPYDVQELSTKIARGPNE